MGEKIEVAVFGGGCFWCTEAVFEMLRGVASVSPGYAGGNSTGDGKNPTYEAVSSGTTGHAEVIKVEFHPQEISYRDLLIIFFASHDPTTKNRQGNDIGTQYRSVIFYTTNAQKTDAEAFIKELYDDAARPIVTEVRPLETFYPAEDYHKNYYERNKNQPYCEVIISPKIEKLKEKYSELLKKAEGE